MKLRYPIEKNMEIDDMNFKDSVVLITGGTGSFGKTISKKFLEMGTKKVIIFSRDEKKQYDLRNELRDYDNLEFHIGDIRDYNSIHASLNNVDYVFHAAALKQVPSNEFFPMEAVKTNIIGSDNVIRAAVDRGVKKVVFLSTDKAVYPINAMGISKAMMEKIVIANSKSLSNSSTIICATRYGNVLASRGSVVPLFINQMKLGSRVTITDPNMTRFLMSLDEAIDLVLFAMEYGNQGDLFIMKSPAAKIIDIAKAIAEIIETDLSYEVIGVRMGEKLSETLMSFEESISAQDLGKFYRIPSRVSNLDYEEFFTKGKVSSLDTSGYNSNNTNQLNVDEIKLKLSGLEEIKELIEGKN
jgi:UDP-N-acetylglucosamine 4,6-dehydratase/5-epimerase